MKQLTRRQKGIRRAWMFRTWLEEEHPEWQNPVDMERLMRLFIGGLLHQSLARDFLNWLKKKQEK